ncbi:MAG: prepilin-type N-terminal cleavage/methylation domain-containing protein [Ruminococcus sp.]|nr:prepilin-type N-terminal cleavage/methylation domain-containing protein [Ruminococcus sp.]
MNKHKKNNSGFTLIELVVVIALLTLMMGAILQLIDPIRNVYHDTLDTVNTKTAGETMISYVEDKTRYATNILVLKNYVGIPKITQSGSDSAKVGSGNVAYTDVMIIDNTNLRGYAFSDYPGDNATVAGRKHCRGTIYNIPKIGASDKLDLTKATTGTVGEAIYGNYTYDVDLTVKTAGGYAMLNFDIASYEMEFNGSDYVRATDPEYKASRYFDLVNINIDSGDSYSVDEVIDFDLAPDYTKYPQDNTYPAGLTTQQQKFFSDTDPNNKYTYIFYKVSKSNEAAKYSVNFQYSDDSPVSAGALYYAAPLQVSAGKTVAPGQIPHPTLPAGTTGYYFTNGSTAVDPATTEITEDTIFTIFFIEDSSYVWHTANFHDVDGSIICSPKVQEGLSAVDQKPSDTQVSIDTTKQYVEWYDGAGNPISSVSCSSSSSPPVAETFDYYPDVIDMYKVEFEIEGSVDDTLTQYVKGGKTGESGGPSIPPVAPVPTDATKVFDNWYVGSTPITSYTVTSDTKFEAKFKDKPPEVCTVSITDPVIESYGGGDVKYTITINNSTSDEVKSWKLKIKLPSGASYNSGPNWDVKNSTSGGYLILENSADTQWDGSINYHPTIGANSSMTINLKLNNPNATRTYDYSQPNPMTEFIPSDCYITDISFEKIV